MNLLREAYIRLFPTSLAAYNFSVKYSGRFKTFGANIHMKGTNITANLSRTWDKVDNDIVIGLLQELLIKIFKKNRVVTKEIELYKIFVKHMHIIAVKHTQEPELLESFKRMNSWYLDDLVETPNLIWGKRSYTVMGHYNFHTDTITISGSLKKAPQHLIDFVMYHEMLHKLLKFDPSKVKPNYHTAEFRQMEKQFDNFQQTEEELKEFAKKKKFQWWF